VEPHEQITIAEYQATAESYRLGTWNHDVSQNREALIAALPRSPGRILDLGCGPGRDLVAFCQAGHQVIGIDGTEAFVKYAQKVSGCEVWQQSFLDLELPLAAFDGIFANASLIHVPRSQMVAVLKTLHGALVPKGALVMSMFRGEDEGYTIRPTGMRYVVGWEYETLAPCLELAGFSIVKYYYRPPGLPQAAQNWLVIVAKQSG